MEKIMTEDDAKKLKPPSAPFYLVTTIAINFFTALIYPAVSCGCHFSWAAFFLALIAISAGLAICLICLIKKRDFHSRVVGYVALILALLWLFLSDASILIFK